MQFSCSRTALSDVLSLLADIAPTRSAKPVLQNILIQGEADGSIMLAATDLEIAVRMRMAVDDLTDPESILLPSSKFAAIIRDDWSETVSIKADAGKATIKTDSGSFTLLGNADEEFPSIASLGDDGVVSVSATDLVDAVQKTLFAAAKGDTRYALNGVLLQLEKNAIDFVASDTHRLSLVHKKAKHSVESGRNGIVITKGMSVLARLADGEEQIKLQLTSHELIGETSKATLVARLVDGQFPRYRDVIPKDLDKKVTVSREMLAKVLRLGGQISNEETHSITLAASGEKLAIHASSKEAGEGDIEIDAETEGGEIAVNFNYTYILELIRVLSDETVTIQMKNTDAPVRVDAGDFTHIIMPIKPQRG